MLIATHNTLIHDYLGIDDATVWSIITTDADVLLAKLRQLSLKPSSDTGSSW